MLLLLPFENIFNFMLMATVFDAGRNFCMSL